MSIILLILNKYYYKHVRIYYAILAVMIAIYNINEILNLQNYIDSGQNGEL